MAKIAGLDLRFEFEMFVSGEKDETELITPEGGRCTCL